MSNWNGTARTNYVRFKDEVSYEAAKAVADKAAGLEWHPHPIEKWTAMISGGCPDTGGFDFSVYGDDVPDDGEGLWWPDIAQHMADGQVLVVMEAGAEGLRYLTGEALAFINDPDLTCVAVSLNDIYKLASERFGVDPATATYMNVL